MLPASTYDHALTLKLIAEDAAERIPPPPSHPPPLDINIGSRELGNLPTLPNTQINDNSDAHTVRPVDASEIITLVLDVSTDAPYDELSASLDNNVDICEEKIELTQTELNLAKDINQKVLDDAFPAEQGWSLSRLIPLSYNGSTWYMQCPLCSASQPLIASSRMHTHLK